MGGPVWNRLLILTPAFADCLLWASLRVPWNSVVATEAGAIPGLVALNASLPWLWVVHSYISWRPGFLRFRKVINPCKSQKNIRVHGVQQIDRPVRESSDPPPPHAPPSPSHSFHFP